MSLIDLFKGFHREAIQQEFPPSSRVLFDTLVYQFNEAFWIDNLVLSERDLIRLTGLKKTTLHDAIHFLTSRYIIERKPFKNKFMFFLGDEMIRLLSKRQDAKERQPTSNRPVTDQSPTSNRPLLENPYIRAREDVKTLDLLSSSSARESEKNLDALIDYWQDDLQGGRLSFEHQSELQVLLNRYGFSWVREAMTEASDANGSRHGLSMKLFRAVVKRRLEPKREKGAGKIVRINEPCYREPDTANDPDWRKYLTGGASGAS